jgi:hypothetical protein
MKHSLAITAVIEVATGMALFIVPSLVGRVLLGAELAGVSIPVARVLGIALIALSAGASRSRCPLHRKRESHHVNGCDALRSRVRCVRLAIPQPAEWEYIGQD